MGGGLRATGVWHPASNMAGSARRSLFVLPFPSFCCDANHELCLPLDRIHNHCTIGSSLPECRFAGRSIAHPVTDAVCCIIDGCMLQTCQTCNQAQCTEMNGISPSYTVDHDQRQGCNNARKILQIHHHKSGRLHADLAEKPDAWDDQSQRSSLEMMLQTSPAQMGP